jgi:hypothetical protein
MWNERERQLDPATAEYSALMRVASGDHPADRAYDDPSPHLLGAGFVLEPPASFVNAQSLDGEGLVRRAFSASYVPKEGGVADDLLAGLVELFSRRRGPDGRIVLRYATRIVAGRRGGTHA